MKSNKRERSVNIIIFKAILEGFDSENSRKQNSKINRHFPPPIPRLHGFFEAAVFQAHL